MSIAALKELALKGQQRSLERALENHRREYALLSFPEVEQRLMSVRKLATVKDQALASAVRSNQTSSLTTARYTAALVHVELRALEERMTELQPVLKTA